MSLCQIQLDICDAIFVTYYLNVAKKFLVESHRKSKLYQAKLITTSSSQGKQTYIQLNQANIKKKLVSSFLALDVPLNKLNHCVLKSLLAAMGASLPSKTAAVQALLN